MSPREMSPGEQSWMHRPYPEQCRRCAVELARLREKPVTWSAADLGIAQSCPHRGRDNFDGVSGECEFFMAVAGCAHVQAQRATVSDRFDVEQPGSSSLAGRRK